MEVSKLFEKASSLYDTAHEKCAKSGIDISSITLILSDTDTIFHGVNWKRLKDDFTEEETCSEYEALIKMILSGETKIKSIITLNNKKATVKPCIKCTELILRTNIENKNCNIITGKKSQITLSSSDKETSALIEKIENELLQTEAAENTAAASEQNKIEAVPAQENINVSDAADTEKTENPSDANTAVAENGSDTKTKPETASEVEAKEEVKPEAEVKEETKPEAGTEPEAAPEAASEIPTQEPAPSPASFDMESIGVTGNEVLTSAAEDKQAHSNENSTFEMEEINKDNAPEPIDSIPARSDADNQQFVQMADINDKTEESNENKSEDSPVSHLGIDNSGLKMIFDDWEAIDVTENNEDSIANKPFNLNSLNSVENTPAPENTSNPATAQQAPDMIPNPNMGPNQMYQQQPMNGMYQQQPMNGMYQQQPMNGMYQQQPMNGMYQQQPMNGMYQQQPMNGMYQQQPMTGMYQQQPMNGMYQQQPMTGMYQQQSMNSMYQRQPVNSINSPGSLYLNQMQQPQSVSISNYQNPYSSNMQNSTNSISRNTTQSMSVYGTNINTSDNNAIFKDRLNNILNSSSKPSTPVSEEQQYEDALQSARDKKKAAKIDAKFLRKQKKNGNL